MRQLLPIATLFACAVACAESDRDIGERVSLFRLISNPDAYHGKVVFVTGYVQIALENISICPSKEPLTSKDCLWLNIDDGPFETKKDMDRYEKKRNAWQPFHKTVASIRATFDKDESGHLGGSSGGLRNITEAYGKKTMIEFRSKSLHAVPQAGR